MNKSELSQAESEIMELIWGQAMEWISIPQILEKLPQKQWKYTTVATFVTRLKDKGFLETSKCGAVNVYSPIISNEEYLNMRTQDFMSHVHKGSPKSLMAALYSDKLSQDDYKELMELIEKYEEV